MSLMWSLLVTCFAVLRKVGSLVCPHVSLSVCLHRQEQLHELLASEAHYKWADMSKVSINLQKSYVDRMIQRSVAVCLIATRCSVSLTLMVRVGLIKKA